MESILFSGNGQTGRYVRGSSRFEVQGVQDGVQGQLFAVPRQQEEGPFQGGVQTVEGRRN